jgi:serine/threonine protein kinase
LYLAQKLCQQDQSTHAREALNVDVNAAELLQNKVLLGEGAYGKVYQVHWLGMQCAVKQIVGKTAIDEEVKILSKLHHPNIIQVCLLYNPEFLSVFYLTRNNFGHFL